MLAIVDRWPPKTWNSLTERALYQARRLHQFATGSRGGFVVIESAADLSSYLDRRRLNRRLTAGLLSIEGAQRSTASWKTWMSSTAPDIE